MVGHFERASETERDNPITMKSEIVMKNSPVINLLVATLSLLPLSLTAQQINRTVLPIPEPQPPTITELDARNAKPPPRFEVKAPKGAPNVVVVLLDDIGFGQSSAFGGPCKMPTLDKLAAAGLRYNDFHTTALCSPTRTALLTGRNHHVNNAGAIMELATAFPGNTGIRPQTVAPLAEMLRLNGYSTSAFGKYHETPPWEASVSGPLDRLPTRSVLDTAYGFIGGETNQWAPAIFDGTIRVEPPHDPNYHFTVDMTNQAIAWMQAQHSLTPISPSLSTLPPAHYTLRTMCRRIISIDTTTSSIRVGTHFAIRHSPSKSKWASSRRMQS